MEIIKSGIVISNDIDFILNGKNAFNFKYSEKMDIPSIDFINEQRKQLFKDLCKCFNGDVTILNEEMIYEIMHSLLEKHMGEDAIVSMDHVYTDDLGECISFLDCTRVNGSKKLVTRACPTDENGVEKEIFNISENIKRNNKSSVILADDVVFSGDTLEYIIDIFSKNGITVNGVCSAITAESSIERFKKTLKYGIETGVVLGNDVIDEICERDFYYGIVQGGINVKSETGAIQKAPYFHPFGNPVERASIPEKFSKDFSCGCLERSLELWTKIDELTNREIINNELPEKIINTCPEMSVVKTLKKSLKNVKKC